MSSHQGEGRADPAAVGLPRLHLRRVDSTNLRARALAAAGAPHGTLITAAEQTAGRGRQGRSWSAPSGAALLASLILRDPPELLSLSAGVAVARVAEHLDRERRAATVKWPNDVLLDGRKVAGILVEGRPQDGWAVLGIGLNVSVELRCLDPELRGRAATLGLPAEALEEALAGLLAEMERALALAPRVMLAELRARDALRGRPVTWSGGTGNAAGIDEHGRLRVHTERGTVALDAGEVHLAAAPGAGA
ncbi:MAG TPA: biotin--[acetyl-CoA-carboxylase] ligase [Solirubrobacteraceae bacterium]|nr:biotin--[acetyl-CoA-carboxylase] ligase [Solirubrobacteraceae bacterium]